MNMHAAQNVLAETELRHLAAIPYQIISPASNSPIIGIYQDSLLGSYQFTRPNINFTPREAMKLLMMFPNVNTQTLSEEFENKQHISNFEILTQIMPPLTLKYKTKLFGENENYETSNNVLEITNGKWIRGQIEKSLIHSTTKGVLHRVFNDFGNMACSNFIDNLQNIITEYMKMSSFSVGISDLIANKEIIEGIIQVIYNKKVEVQTLIEKVRLGIFENKTSKSNKLEFENQVNQLLNKAMEESGKIGRNSLGQDNRFLKIVNSGSKGNLINISQMVSGLGQQNVDGQRIPYGFDSRTLPHYFKYDDGPNARGFIENSYISGLTANELFFHAMAGRIGLIDTAIKSVTWETPIIIMVNNDIIYTEIGKWIDGILDDETNKTEVQHTEEKRMELFNLKDEVYIPTTDEKGNVTWGELTAITRHDPSNKLYEIKTLGGRFVTVAESRSLLIWDLELQEFKETNSPDVKIGDFVPTTMDLPKSHITMKQINIAKYKKPQLQNNWDFTQSPIHEIFELNEENGIFIGLFLAHGNINNSNIYFTNNNANICQFVKKWFNKYNIHYTENLHVNKNGILTPTIVGTSFILSNFLNKFVGYDDDEQHVPNEALIAPESFICGILNGFYSVLGYISTVSIDINLQDSKQLLEGISMLCNRIGIFGKMEKYENMYQFTIESQWGRIFMEKVNLLEKNKLQRLQTIDWNIADINFKSINNVILDKIVEINIIGSENHPKLYDVTVPSTLNFGLANGMQVRDTSSTGYIQRRLIKGLEDLKVEYDMTVRNSKGKIIQFSYGEDGFDTTKVESQIIPLTEMTLEDIYVHYDILGLDENDKEMLKVYTKSTATRVVKQRAETRQMCKKYVDMMIEERNKIVKSVFKNKNDNMVKLPVSFQNIINNIQGQLQLNVNSIVDITPLEAFKMIEGYFAKLEKSAFISPNHLFKNVYFYYLSPKDLLVNKRFHSKALTLLLETIVLKYNQSIVHPGEMVGIIAGQSVGEPTTQMTLNTFHHSGTATGSNVTRGVPRVEELLRLTKNPKNPSLTIRLKQYDETDRDRAISFANMIEYTKLVDVVKSVKICFDPFDKGTNIEEDKKWLEEFYEFEQMMEECIGEDKEETKLKKSKWVLRMEMDAEILLDKNITIDDIHFAIKNSSYGNTVDCAFSDFNHSNLIFRVRILKEDLKKPKPTTLDQSDEIYLLKNFQDTLLNDIVLRGIHGITNILPRKLQNMVVEEDGKFIRKDIWALETTGSNFLHVLGLDFIDAYNTYSNDIREVYDILGIEAARQMLFNEITEVMEYSDAFINYHHLSLLCDRMCIKENLVPIFRSGILNDNIGPIAKSTFEVHTEVLLNAAKHAELDHMRGVSASVMCGQYGNYGTGAFNLILDMNEMHKLADMAINTENADDEIAKQFGFRKMDKCSNLEIQNNISNIQRNTGGEICDDNYNMGF